MDCFAIRTDSSKFINEFCIGHHRINQCSQQVFLLGCKLIQKTLIARVDGMQEQHDLENLRDGYQQARECQKIPLESQTKLLDPFCITLPVVEEGQQGSESVGDGRGAEVVFKDLKHLKALVKVIRTSVLKEKPGGAVFQSSPDLTLPELAGKRIGRIRDEGGV
jgi:hypothetical protein